MTNITDTTETDTNTMLDDLPSPTTVPTELVNTIEALLFASQEPLTAKSLVRLVAESMSVQIADIEDAINALQQRYADTAIEVVLVATGYRLQTREAHAPVVTQLFTDRPQRYSRALLETLALIVYQQPITRGEISDVRGVAVSSNVIRTLEERGWIEVVGQKEVPGRPALFGTTPELLNALSLQSLDELPPLPEMKNISALPAEQLLPTIETLDDEEIEDGETLEKAADEQE